MKTKPTLVSSGLFRALLLGAGLFIAAQHSTAQEARFFRIAGAATTKITAFNPDGSMVWTNGSTNATFTVQTATSLLGASNWVDYVQIPVINGINTNIIVDFHPPGGMVLIPAGSFTMGNCMDTNEGYSDELPLHTVYVLAFYMDKYEVTKAQWDNVYSWAITNGYSFTYVGEGKALNHPVQSINWYDCVKWCNARSEKEGKIPAYYMDAAQSVVYRTVEADVDNSWVKWNTGYRLPTEAEWEMAARGGASGHRFPWSNVDTITHSQGNYNSGTNDAYDVSPTRGYHPTFSDSVLPHTSPVGYFAPNGYGLYDMAGNVWEWCWDWYSISYYSSSPTTDPHGLASGSRRVYRGGSYATSAFNCRLALRSSFTPPAYSSIIIGFRSILSPGQ